MSEIDLWHIPMVISYKIKIFWDRPAINGLFLKDAVDKAVYEKNPDYIAAVKTELFHAFCLAYKDEVKEVEDVKK